MPIPLPNLDDRTYEELTGEAQALLPSINPTWTNHNPSDPGMVLIEMMAWLTELLLFRVNEVTDANTHSFLRLLNGPGWALPARGNIDDAVRETIVHLRERYRAVTPVDYEQLTQEQWPLSDAAQALGEASRIRRVSCVPSRNLAAEDAAIRQRSAAGHVSLVLVPEPSDDPSTNLAADDADFPQPTAELRSALWDFFDPRRVLTTHHHVVGPEYLTVEVGANLALREDAPPQLALAAARNTLEEFCHPLTGGLDGTGWPFGRDLYASEIYALLDQVALVDYVEDVQLAVVDDPARLQQTGDRIAGVALDEHELIRLQVTGLVAYDVYGRQHQEVPPQ